MTMTFAMWVFGVGAIIAVLVFGGLLALSQRRDLPFTVPRAAPGVVLSVAVLFGVLLIVVKFAS